jgi:hypothetical protein
MSVHSVHTFILPMRWDYLPNTFHPSSGRKGDIPFDKRTNLQHFSNLLTPPDSKAENKWVRKFYRIGGDAKNYNELVYYHSHASVNFFDMQHEDEKDEFTVQENKVCLYFEIKDIDPATDYYKILVKKGPGGNPKEYKLKLSGITLHVYTTGVCLLSYTLKNDEYSSQEDILFINEFGRRIYPPFIENTGSLDATKEKALADRIEIGIASLGADPVAEDFSRYNNFVANSIETHMYEDGKYQYHAVIDFPKTVRQLFDQSRYVFTAGEEEKSSRDIISLRLLTSDRMFFQCWYGNNKLAAELGKEEDCYDGSKGFAFAKNKFWYAFMFGDRSVENLGIGNKYFMENHLLNNTYTRWAEYGTIYGFTNDSFVCLSKDLKTLGENGVPNLALHMQTLYYTMAVLNLVQRASALRFSGEVATLADLGWAKAKDISSRIQNLNLNYIEFINKVYYREISPEIQGIDIYKHFQKAMNIEEDVNDLKMEINELFTYVKMDEDVKQSEAAKKQNDEAHSLNLVASIFLPATFLATVFALFSGDLRITNHFDWQRFFAVIIILVLVILVFMFPKKINDWLQKVFYPSSEHKKKS